MYERFALPLAFIQGKACAKLLSTPCPLQEKEMFDCILRYLAAQWPWIAIWIIGCMIVGFFAGGWWGVAIGFGFGAAIAVAIAVWNCSRK